MAKLRVLTERPPEAEGTEAAQIEALRDYLFRVTEELRHVLLHLDERNFSPGVLPEGGAAAAAPEESEPGKTSMMDFSNWDNGFFMEVVDGISGMLLYTVSFDENNRPVAVRDAAGHVCTIRWDPIPADHILITTPPRRTSYADGDRLDYAGIIVTAYDDEDEPIMTVPVEQLIFPVSEAELPQNEYAKYPDTTYYVAGSQANVGRLRSGFSSSYYSVLFPQGMRFVLAHRSEGYYFCAVSETAFDSGCYYGRDGGGYVTADTPVDASAYGSTEIDGVTYYYCFWGVINTRTPEDNIDPLVTFPGNWTNAQRIAACIPMCYGPNASRGTPQASVSIPVQWKNGSDTLETSFSITVTGAAT